VPTLLEQLGSLKTHFSPADHEIKVAILRELRTLDISDIPSLIKYHEALCFMRAYPDSPDVLRLAEEALAGFAARVDHLRRPAAPRT
jgi:hypothetical protein